MIPRVSAADITAHLRATGDGATDAARELAPGVDGDDFRRLRLRCQQQRRRLVAAGELVAIGRGTSAGRQDRRGPVETTTGRTEHAVSISTGAPVVISLPTQHAETAAALLSPGGWVLGLTKGQFSLLDLVRAVLGVTGPADVTISTWSTGIKDMESARWLVDNGDMRSLRLLTDRSFPGRQPRYAARLTQLFGPRAIIVSRVHAKIAIVRNERWAVAIRSSMNLNHNPRFEQFDLNDSAAVCDFLGSWVDELQVGMGDVGLQFDECAAEAVFRGALASSVTASEAVAEMLGETAEETAAREAAAEAEAVAATSRAVRSAATPVADGGSGVGLGDKTSEDFLLWELDRLAESVRDGDAGSVAYVTALKASREVHTALLALRQVKPSPTEHDEDLEELDLDAFRRRQLREVRGMRAQAQAEGSMVAATKLLDTESQLLRDIDTARREAEAREAASQDAGQVLARFLAAVDRMPRAQAAELHAALTRALEPAEAK